MGAAPTSSHARHDAGVEWLDTEQLRAVVRQSEAAMQADLQRAGVQPMSREERIRSAWQERANIWAVGDNPNLPPGARAAPAVSTKLDLSRAQPSEQPQMRDVPSDALRTAKAQARVQATAAAKQASQRPPTQSVELPGMSRPARPERPATWTSPEATQLHHAISQAGTLHAMVLALRSFSGRGMAGVPLPALIHSMARTPELLQLAPTRAGTEAIEGDMFAMLRALAAGLRAHGAALDARLLSSALQAAYRLHQLPPAVQPSVGTVQELCTTLVERAVHDMPASALAACSKALQAAQRDSAAWWTGVRRILQLGCAGFSVHDCVVLWVALAHARSGDPATFAALADALQSQLHKASDSQLVALSTAASRTGVPRDAFVAALASELTTRVPRLAPTAMAEAAAGIATLGVGTAVLLPAVLSRCARERWSSVADLEAQARCVWAARLAGQAPQQVQPVSQPLWDAVARGQLPGTVRGLSYLCSSAMAGTPWVQDLPVEALAAAAPELANVHVQPGEQLLAVPVLHAAVLAACATGTLATHSSTPAWEELAGKIHERVQQLSSAQLPGRDVDVEAAARSPAASIVGPAAAIAAAMQRGARHQQAIAARVPAHVQRSWASTCQMVTACLPATHSAVPAWQRYAAAAGTAPADPEGYLDARASVLSIIQQACARAGGLELTPGPARALCPAQLLHVPSNTAIEVVLPDMDVRVGTATAAQAVLPALEPSRMQLWPAVRAACLQSAGHRVLHVSARAWLTADSTRQAAQDITAACEQASP